MTCQTANEQTYGTDRAKFWTVPISRTNDGDQMLQRGILRRRNGFTEKGIFTSSIQNLREKGTLHLMIYIVYSCEDEYFIFAFYWFASVSLRVPFSKKPVDIPHILSDVMQSALFITPIHSPVHVAPCLYSLNSVCKLLSSTADILF